MDNNAAKVEQNPSGSGSALAVVGQDSILFECFSDFFPDGLNLAGAVGVADNKIISKGADFLGIQHHHVVSLLVCSRFHYFTSYFC